MRIVKVKLVARAKSAIKEESMDTQQEYDALKALNALTGKKILLRQIENFAFTVYKDKIHLKSIHWNVDEMIHNDQLFKLKLYPSTFTDFLYFNGATAAKPGGEYRPTTGPSKLGKPQGNQSKHWVQKPDGFWKQE